MYKRQPLAPFYHFALAKWLGADAPIAFLNLGGVGNVTWVDPRFNRPEEIGALLAFDTGPANAPINDVMQARLGQPYDEGGCVAAKGRADEGILAQLAAHPYFALTPPKSLDRDDFAMLIDAVGGLDTPDAITTLTCAAVQSVRHAMVHCPAPVATIYVAGGGRKNAALMKGLSDALDCSVLSVDDVGLDGDMLEAQAFAYLAVRAAKGLPISAPGTTGVVETLTGGRVSTIDAAPQKSRI